MMNRKKALITAIFGLFVVAFVGFSYVTAHFAGVIKTTLADATYDHTGLELDVDALELSVLQGDVHARGLLLNEPKQHESLAMAQTLTVDADPWSFLGEVIAINRISLLGLDAVVDIAQDGTVRIPSPPRRPPSAETKRGFRIDSISVNADNFVIRHELPEGQGVNWALQPMDLTVEGVHVPPSPGSQVHATLSAVLIEPSRGNLGSQLIFTRGENQWDILCHQKVQVNQVEALNPYLPESFPLIASSGSLVVTNSAALRDTIFETTMTVALSRPRFKPRERTVQTLFTGPMSQFAIQAIKDSEGDIILDPIYIRGDLNDPQFDPKSQLLTNIRTQLLHRIFRGAKSIPADMAKKLTGVLSSLPSVPGKAGVILNGAGQVGGKARDVGADLAGKAQKVGKTATGAAKDVGSRLKRLFGK
ncbi:MAG: hypothetical protein ABIH23_28175 [bacterium]